MSVVAFDFGASSGRALVGKLEEGRLTLQEIHRFSNDPVQVGDHLHWDILRLFHEVKQGILKTKHLGITDVKSMAIDSWAIDFGLIDANGELLGNPYHYRDHHTDGLMEEVCQLISEEEIFQRTGIQFLSFNTIYQLYALQKNNSAALEKAERLLMIPDLLRYFLTGEQKGEFTNATTTQLFNVETRTWDIDLAQRIGIPTSIFGEVVEPGTVIGHLRESVCEELGISPFPVIAVGEHDTASAVAAVPADEEDFAYLSCGTWSLLGTEVKTPVMNAQAKEWNFTNEGGVNNTYRLLKNIMGLWLVQECMRVWEKEGTPITYDEMNRLVGEAKPFIAWIDPDHPMFLNPVHMPRQIQQYCRQTNQAVPETKGEIIRCILENLALKYRVILERTEQITGKRFKGLHIVGGGTQNKLLCQFTANALSRPAWAGPTEATAIGNLVIQYMSLGEIKTIQEARAIIRASFPIETYEPEQQAEWEHSFQQFINHIEK